MCVVNWTEVKFWGKSVCAICVGKNIRNYIQYFLPLHGFLIYIFVNCIFLCIVVVLCVFVILRMCLLLLYFRCRTAARSQCQEGLATGHLDTGFSWFPCVYKRMLRWFPCFQVAAKCFSYSPPNLNFLVTHLIFVYI